MAILELPGPAGPGACDRSGPTTNPIPERGPDLVLGRAQHDLLVVLEEIATPRRVLAVEGLLGRTVDLHAAFPGATIRRDTLSVDPPAWAGWPDLLWLGFALSPLAVDAARAIAIAARALPAGAIVASVDLAGCGSDDTRAILRDGFGLDPERDTHELLREAFVAQAWIDRGHPHGLWRTYSFLGVNGRTATGRRRSHEGPP